ncbi:MAG: hypothetical protein ACRDTT_29435 [Pseudonocardiaceae bacterium]
MTCVVSLVAHGNEQLSVSAAVEAPWASVRFRIVGEPVEVRVETADASALIRGLLRATQQLCDTAVASGVALPGTGWGRAALLVDDALVVLAGEG